MKSINIKIWFISFLAVCSMSCNNDDGQELFADSPAERIANRNAELTNLLISQNQGYKAVYFSKNDEFGGFTYYMQFNADGTVAMTSDFDAETAIELSSYEVRLGTTNELVFTTRNHIQKVSNPSFPGLVGTGYKGTSVFQYFKNENGVLTFRDVRNSDSGFLVLTPTNFADFESESVAKAEASLAQRENILPTPTSSVFQLLSIENANGLSSFNFNYDPLRLYASPRITLDDGSVTEFNFGLSFTENGLVISPVLEFEGEVYEEFIYDSSSSSYISEVNGTTAKILFSNEPAFIGRDVFDLLEIGGDGYLYRPGLGSNPLTSPGHDAIIAEVNENLSGFGLSFFDYILFLDFESDNCLSQLLIRVQNTNGDIFNAFYCFERAVIQDRKLFLTYAGPAQGNGPLLEASVAPIITFFNSTEGMIHTNEGSFSSSLGSFSNLAGTFTSVQNPSQRVYGLFF
ncbi:DUF4302 domain-containing protein [Algibacter mikhailovii]|uniref:DUF4302 domain-containing protein n=1 Tax=Algibacter mikhailovii TaxID=425498 RepID=UPI002493F6D3|nr:DUF4302 domain-containing protein [Algibacter mikhailovii]